MADLAGRPAVWPPDEPPDPAACSLSACGYSADQAGSSGAGTANFASEEVGLTKVESSAGFCGAFCANILDSHKVYYGIFIGDVSLDTPRAKSGS
jgi:hypothetical protein